MNLCISCSKPTKNPKFCSRDCAARTNNKLYPKRKLIKKCKTCNTFIRSTVTYCKNCKITVQDYMLKEVMYDKHHKSSAFALVRSRARQVIKTLGISACEKCGYNKHVEACHIKPIADFELTTKLSIINDRSNLLALCPNCHWELDNL